jgi:rhamnosyl/mannosyltransferase
VAFVGRIPEEELPAYYQACDIFCLPSVERSEAFGIVQVEAMAAGKPVLCCQLDNGVNWVNPHGVTGLAVAPRDPPALAAALRQLFADEPLRRALGAAAARRASENFSLAALGAGTLAVYRRSVQ